MRRTTSNIVLSSLLTIASFAVLADDAVPTTAETPTQSVASANALLQQTVWKGFLFAAPSNSVKDVLAVLKEEKKQKNGAFLLRTEDPILATRLQELSHSHKGCAVVMNGRMDPARTNSILVTALLELPKERKPERK